MTICCSHGGHPVIYMLKKLNHFIYNLIAPYDLYIQHKQFMKKVYDDKIKIDIYYGTSL